MSNVSVDSSRTTYLSVIKASFRYWLASRNCRAVDHVLQHANSPNKIVRDFYFLRSIGVCYFQHSSLSLWRLLSCGASVSEIDWEAGKGPVQHVNGTT